MDRPVRRRPSENSIVTKPNRLNLLFVTVCTSDRKPVLANERAARAILRSWQEADHWQVGRYVIMPNHLHFFYAPYIEDPDLKSWISYWKRLVTQEIDPKEKNLWQSGFWDTQMRTVKMYEEKWEYIRHNPVRHGLVDEPAEWKYADEMNLLEWYEG